MPRSPIADAPREVRLTFRTTEREKARINRLRGSLTMADYIRGLVDADERRRVNGPNPEDDV